MTTAAIPGARGEAGGAPEGASAADVLVVFGITGDLAKVMTFRSLYRLERRGLLDCPIVGVAVDDWSVDDLRERARTSIEGDRRDARPGGLRPLRRAAVLRVGRLRRPARRSSAWRRPSRARAAPVFYLEIPPFLFGTVIKGLSRRRPDRGRARGRREAVRPRPRVGARAGGRDPPVHRRVAAVPDRPLPGEDGDSPRSSTCASPTRCSSRSGAATTSRRSRSRWPRASASRTAGTSTTLSARCATSSSTT